MMGGHSPKKAWLQITCQRPITAPCPRFHQDAVGRYWRVIAIIKYIVSIVGTYTCCPSTTPILNPGYRRPRPIAFRGLAQPNHVMVVLPLNHSRINPNVRSRMVIDAECGLCVPEVRCRSRQMQVSRSLGVRMSECVGFLGLAVGLGHLDHPANRQAAFGPAPSSPLFTRPVRVCRVHVTPTR